MCGRFSLISTRETLEEEFQFEYSGELPPRYNIAPGQEILAIISPNQHRAGRLFHWGLIPFWASDEKIGYKMINARAETLNEKSSFKNPLKKRRCIIPADGYFEWKREGKLKQPYRFVQKDGKPLAFAGLWEVWEGKGKRVESCTIITTNANEMAAEVHDRMPVILTPEKQNIWLDQKLEDSLLLQSLLNPYESEKMEMYEVSTLVNSVKNESNEIIRPFNSK